MKTQVKPTNSHRRQSSNNNSSRKLSHNNGRLNIFIPAQRARPFTHNLVSVRQLASKHDVTFTGDKVHLPTKGPASTALSSGPSNKPRGPHAYLRLNGEPGGSSGIRKTKNDTKPELQVCIWYWNCGSAPLPCQLNHNLPELLVHFTTFYPSAVKAFRKVSQDLP